MKTRPNQAEGEILAMMIGNEEFRIYALGKLKPVDFEEDNRKIYEVISKLDRKGKKIELDSIAVLLGTEIELPVPREKKDYEAIVDSMQEKRAQVDTLSAIEDFYDTYQDDFKKAQNDLTDKLVTNGSVGFNIKIGDENITAYMDYAEDESRHTSIGKFGISGIDYLLGGIFKQRIYTVISGSGVGKSSIAVQVFEESMKMGTKCLFITTEMTGEQLIARMLARITGISPLRFAPENLSDTEKEKIAMAEGELGILLESTGSIIATDITTSSEVANLVRFMALTKKVDLVILDHLHNLRGSSDIYSRVSDAAHDIQGAVYKSGVAMVMLAQMNRADKKESNSDMVSSKGSGDVEEVSDVMIRARRDRVDQSKQNDLELTIIKNRHGVTGIVDAKMEFPSLIIKPISRGYNVPSLD